MVFGKNSEKLELTIGNALVRESDEKTLLGFLLDKDVRFKSHIKILC